jgi:hypothetical protein
LTTGVTADAQVDVLFSNASSGCTLQVNYVTIPTATGTRTVQAESGGTVFDRGAETSAPGANAFDGVNVANGAELMSETGSLRFVVGLKSLASGYDACDCQERNRFGNMTMRLKDGARFFLTYDAESRLTSVSGTVSASFTFNGDSQRVTATIGTTITTYIGGYFEWQGGAGRSYSEQHWRESKGIELLSWGEVRWASGTTPTDYRFTDLDWVVFLQRSLV